MFFLIVFAKIMVAIYSCDVILYEDTQIINMDHFSSDQISLIKSNKSIKDCLFSEFLWCIDMA